jgi:hypothetical protein
VVKLAAVKRSISQKKASKEKLPSNLRNLISPIGHDFTIRGTVVGI